MPIMITFLRTPILLLILFTLFLSCSKESNLVPTIEEEEPIKLSMANSAIKAESVMEYTEKGLIFTDKYSLFDSTRVSSGSLARSVDEDMNNTTFKFHPNTDSVSIRGLIYVASEYKVQLKRIGWQTYNSLIDLKFPYRFENNEFWIELTSHFPKLPEKKWVKVGYGTKENFSVYINYKHAFFAFVPYSVGTSGDYMAFVDPSYALAEREIWQNDYLASLPDWNFKTGGFNETLKLNYGSLLVETIKRYDFNAEENK